MNTMLSALITIGLIIYILIFSTRYHKIKKKLITSENLMLERQLMFGLVLMSGIPIILVFGILPKTETNNAVNGVLGVIVMILPFIFGGGKGKKS